MLRFSHITLMLATFITITLAVSLTLTAPAYAIDDFSEETLTCIECHSVSRVC
mgnify:CR=1 FL=1